MEFAKPVLTTASNATMLATAYHAALQISGLLIYSPSDAFLYLAILMLELL